METNSRFLLGIWDIDDVILFILRLLVICLYLWICVALLREDENARFCIIFSLTFAPHEKGHKLIIRLHTPPKTSGSLLHGSPAFGVR